MGCYKEALFRVEGGLAMNELRSKVEDAIYNGFTEEALNVLKGQLHDAFTDLENSLEDRLKSDISYDLAAHTERMAHNAIEAMLNGDDEMMRQHLQCASNSYNGRRTDNPVIRGKLFESTAVELRKQIVEAHADLLKNERILDLEDQVKSVLAHYTALDARYMELCARY